MRPALVLALIAIAGFAFSSAEAEQLSGRIVVDLDQDGVADASEPGWPGVAVTNGREVVRADAAGRYRLPERAGGFVAVTRPDGARADAWYRSGGGDFALTRTAGDSSDGLFFIHMSDAHTFEKPEDLYEVQSTADIPWWLPRFVIGHYVLGSIVSIYSELGEDGVADALRVAAAPHVDLSNSWNSTTVIAYLALAARSDTGLIDPAGSMRASMAEIARLEPRFVVNTGDLVMEGNQAGPEAAERWTRNGRDVLAASGLEIYTTIGNNELAGTDNDEFLPGDPRYGKALFRKYFGPTHYSFDRGGFHFVALDTHRPAFDTATHEPGDNEPWAFEEMEPDVRAWLENDLRLHSDRIVILLNHEPFHDDPAWDFDDPYDHSDDEGLLDEYAVAYTLSGHIHKNGFTDGEPTTHITTGALSGFRWLMPESIAARGYRLVYGREGRLYSAWKPTGEPVVGFIQPVEDGDHHPASKAPDRPDRLSGAVDVVAVAADADSAFARVSVRLDGEELPVQRWGRYFVHARFSADRLSAAPALLELEARRADGTTERSKLVVSTPSTPLTSGR